MPRDYFEALCEAEPTWFSGIPKDQARKIWEAGRNLTRNQFLVKASEMLTRPKTHPTKAILEGLEYAGIQIPPGHTFEEMEADMIKQSARLFEAIENREARLNAEAASDTQLAGSTAAPPNQNSPTI